MGKPQKKTGKSRLDKYYKLAKEQGYRARSAFKLIQLNKKYNFLESSRCTIDLCAAPGGWLQVASKYMPVNSIIIGVDLVPIKPIPRVTAFAADITTPRCRDIIRGELKDWKADVVLHDGAPNVGTAWIQDAYSQSELVLGSLKLAVEFLAKGGTFVTKIFRSVDYNSLIWVFNQLFGKVEATKPPSSRNVSAEIFVVCRGFLAPKFVDPKFLDPRHVFKEVPVLEPADKGVPANNVQENIFHPEKKRRQREGYTEGNYTLYKVVNASDFIRGRDPLSILGSVNKIIFNTDEEKGWLEMDLASEDVKANCEDLRVLGKGDFKTLMKWRILLRQELGLENKTKETEENTEVVQIEEKPDQENQITEELERLNAETAVRAKRERRRANEIKQRSIQRMQLQMMAPLDIGLEQHDLSLGGRDDFFDLETTEHAFQASRRLKRFTGDVEADEANEERHEDSEDTELDHTEAKVNRLEHELEGFYEEYQSRLRARDLTFGVKDAKKHATHLERWDGIHDKSLSNDGEESGDESDEGGWDQMQQAKEKIGMSSDDDSSDEDSPPAISGSKRHHTIPSISNGQRKRVRLIAKLEGHGPKTVGSKAVDIWFSRDEFADAEEPKEEMEADDEAGKQLDDVTVDHDDTDFEVVPQGDEDDDKGIWKVEHDDTTKSRQNRIQRFGLVTPEAMTLAQKLVNRQTTVTELVNNGFDRYSLNSREGLPSWFLDDEAEHYKLNIPITKEAMAALRTKQRILNARPIKKIAEAKARKKLRAQQRLEKAMKKAEGINTADLTEREKAMQIERLMRKGMSQKAQKNIKVVVAKGIHKGIKGRPKGVRGRYTMVDARMRKELRVKQRAEKVHKKRG